MLSYFFKKQEEVKEEEVVPDPDFDFSDGEDWEVDRKDEVNVSMQKLHKTAVRNLEKGYFFEATKQFEQLETLFNKALLRSTLKIPPEILEFFDGEIFRDSQLNSKRLNEYLANIEEFSNDWQLYSESGDI